LCSAHVSQREEQERLEREAAAHEIEAQRQKAIEAQIRRDQEKREEARQLKETLERQMEELKDREAEVMNCCVSFIVVSVALCIICNHLNFS